MGLKRRLLSDAYVDFDQYQNLIYKNINIKKDRDMIVYIDIKYAT